MKAFPAGDQSFSKNQGMTLRDYFAAQALAGVVSRTAWSPLTAADEAYRYADAMLKRREVE